MTRELKPCPKCGGKAEEKHNLSPAHWVECLSCGFMVGDWPVKMWNEWPRTSTGKGAPDIVPGQHKADCDNHWCQGGDDCKRWAALGKDVKE